jgi:hypothetical protein
MISERQQTYRRRATTYWLIEQSRFDKQHAILCSDVETRGTNREALDRV